MSRQVSMLINPTLEECVVACVNAGMPEREGQKMFVHYELCGWKYGKGKVPISSLALVVSGWKLRWEENGCPGVNGHKVANPNSGVILMAKAKELERVLARMKVLVDGVDSHTQMRESSRIEFEKLKQRRNELRKDLGVKF